MNEEIKAVLFGKKVAKRIVAEHPNMKIVFTFESIGDQCMGLAYLREYQKYNRINRIGVLTTNPDHALFKYFDDAYDELITISKNDYSVLLKFYKSDFGQIYRRTQNQIICAFYTAYVRSDLLLDNQYVRLSDIEKLIYRIPKDTMPCTIHEIQCEDWIESLVSEGRVQPGKTVLINPYANSCPGVPIALFEKLAIDLKVKGFKVITSLHGTQQPIPGTDSLAFPLEKAISLVNMCGFVVGIRSGFLDLCAFSKAVIVSIDHESYKLADATRLEEWWPQNKNIRTYRFQNGNVNQIINDIESFLIDFI